MTSKPKTAFLFGLWLNHESFPFPDNFPTLDQMLRVSFTGLHSLEDRVRHLMKFLNGNPSVTQLIAHSAACEVVRSALKQLEGRIIQVVLLNPAPVPGVKFMPTDRLFWVSLRNFVKMLTGRAVKPTLEQFHKLSVPVSPSEYDSMEPESGQFLLSASKAQWKQRHPVRTRIQITTYTAGEEDTMLGSTKYLTRALWHGHTKQRYFDEDYLDSAKLQKNALTDGPVELSSSHFGTVKHIDITLEFLRSKTGFTL